MSFSNKIILEAKGVSKYFGTITALEDVNLTIKEGECLGVVGDNGAGKSTFMKVLSGLGYINNLDGFGDDGGIIDNETFRAMLSVDITEDLNLLYTYSMFDSSGTPVYANCEVYTNSPMLAGGPALNFVPNDMKTRGVEDCNATGHYDSYHDSTFGDSYLDLDKLLNLVLLHLKQLFRPKLGT